MWQLKIQSDIENNERKDCGGALLKDGFDFGDNEGEETKLEVFGDEQEGME